MVVHYNLGKSKRAKANLYKWIQRVCARESQRRAVGNFREPFYGLTPFLGERPGTQIGIGKDPKDKLLFHGVEDQVGFGEHGPLLHFLRSVEAPDKDDAESSELDRAFTEDYWFAKGKGLVRLEQKVEGKRSMVWTLVEK